MKLTTPQIAALIGAAEAMLAGVMDGTGDDIGVKRTVLERAFEALKNERTLRLSRALRCNCGSITCDECNW